MKKLYEKPDAEFVSFHLLAAVASSGQDFGSYGAGYGEEPDDSGYQRGDGPGLMN